MMVDEFMNYKELYLADKKRIHGGHALRFVKYLRHAQYNKGVVRLFYRVLLNRMMLRYGLEIPWTCKIGKGLYLGHAYNITVNPHAEIGEWCNLHKGLPLDSRIGVN